MRTLHPNLGRNAWGRRKFVYVLCALLTAISGLGSILLVGFKVIPGTPLDVYFSWFIFFVLWLPFVALCDKYCKK